MHLFFLIILYCPFNNVLLVFVALGQHSSVVYFYEQ